MKQYFIRLLSDEIQFDEVPQSVFDKRQYALNEDGEPRYHPDDYVVVEGATIERLQLSDCGTRSVGLLCRAMGIPEAKGPSGTFVHEPTHIKFRDKRSEWLLDIKSGDEYKLRKK
jgi:hypothetical protein